MRYVDGFVLPVPKRHLEAYLRMARKAGKVWRDHGALEVRECAGDDLNVKMAVSFPRSLKLKGGETVVFSWIAFKSRAHREDDGAERDAFRSQAHALRWLQGHGRGLSGGKGR